MTADIDTIARTPNEAVISISGRLSQDAVPLLDGEIGHILVDAERVFLDVKRVRFIDNRALSSLQRWARSARGDRGGPRIQLAVRDGSRFVRLQLASRGLAVD